jgi:myo-inositol-1(or 4)-monophosphatase
MSTEFVAVAERAAREAGTLQMAMLPETQAVKQVAFKRNPTDLVTRADRDSEALIVRALRDAFPTHGILAEEGSKHSGDDYQWYIDPLDGTTNFAHGIPLFAVSIGLALRGGLVAGVVYHPPSDEMFIAQRGGGAYLRRGGGELPLRVSSIATVADAVVATGLPYDIRDTGRNTAQIAALTRVAQEVRILGAAALHLAYVAAGRLECFWEPGLNPWDIAAGSLLVEEAGGGMTDIGGRPFTVDCADVLASNGRIHQEMVSLLSRSA